MYEFIDEGDAFNFHRGETYVYDDRLGNFRPQTRWDRVKDWFARLTWWRQNRLEVTDIDEESGIVEFRRLRWSWTRWRWVP